MQFKSETVTNGVVERLFDVAVSGGPVPGVIWAPEGASGKRPLLLMGHGGSQHKKAPGLLARAQRFVKNLGFAVAAIDAPSHGDRTPDTASEQFFAEVRRRVQARQSIADLITRDNETRPAKAVPEWRAALDVIEQFDFVGAGGPVGYCGFSMGGATGVHLVAAEPRIQAAVFALVGLFPEQPALARAAARITVPIEFALQWDDELVTHEAGFALYTAFQSREKSLHMNPGGHMELPLFETDSWERFFERHLKGREE